MFKNMFCCKFVKFFPFTYKKFDKPFSEFYNNRRKKKVRLQATPICWQHDDE